MKRALITGGAGFIGSHLADRLVSEGVEVVVLDDFRTGHREFIAQLFDNPLFDLVEGDVLDEVLLARAIEGCDWVFNLQANADVRFGFDHPALDIEQNTVTVSRVLEAMRASGTANILLSSTGSAYGEPDIAPTPEDAPFPVQTSLYGASKVAAEGLIGAYVAATERTGVRAGIICRFVSILGERYTHGHVVDFFRKLHDDPGSLEVLGDGLQEKSYLYVGDCVSGMLAAARHHEGTEGIFTYNLGTDETIVVDDSLKIITGFLGLEPEIKHAGGRRGWPGDSPLILLDTRKLRSIGWSPTLTIPEAITRTVAWLNDPENRALVLGGQP